MVSVFRNPNDFLVTNFTFVLRPSTTPEEYSFFARKELRISSRWDRSILALAFIGLMPLRMAMSHHLSRNFPAQVGET